MPERLSGLDLLEQFRASNTQLMLVIDEYGEINGLVTLADVLQALTGEFRPRDLKNAWAVRREDGSWLLDGLTPPPRCPPPKQRSRTRLKIARLRQSQG